jgi:hypothetical protein
VAKPFLPLIRPFLLPPGKGARAALRLAAAPELAGLSGRYYLREREHPSPGLSDDHALQERICRRRAAHRAASAPRRPVPGGRLMERRTVVVTGAGTGARLPASSPPAAQRSRWRAGP